MIKLNTAGQRIWCNQTASCSHIVYSYLLLKLFSIFFFRLRKHVDTLIYKIKLTYMHTLFTKIIEMSSPAHMLCPHLRLPIQRVYNRSDMQLQIYVCIITGFCAVYCKAISRTFIILNVYRIDFASFFLWNEIIYKCPQMFHPPIPPI